MEKKNQYLIAVRRDQRSTAPSNLAGSIDKIDGLEILGVRDSRRLRVEATDEAINQVKDLLSKVCHIETPIEHNTN